LELTLSILYWLTAELPILEHMTKMKEKGSAEKPTPQSEKPRPDKPVHKDTQRYYTLATHSLTHCCA